MLTRTTSRPTQAPNLICLICGRVSYSASPATFVGSKCDTCPGKIEHAQRAAFELAPFVPITRREAGEQGLTNDRVRQYAGWDLHYRTGTRWLVPRSV